MGPTESGSDDLVDHIARLTAMPPAAAGRLVAEVLHYFSESVEDFVRRRHRQLQSSGLTNAEIFGRLGEELAARRFVAPDLSERQIRRIVYG